MTHILQKHFPNDATCTIERLGPINWRRTEPANCCSKIKKEMVPLYGMVPCVAEPRRLCSRCSVYTRSNMVWAEKPQQKYLQ